MSKHKKFDFFLCHNSQDKPIVERIARNLQQNEIKPWFGTWELIPGDSWQEVIEAGLESSRTCAVIMGKSGFGPWDNEQMRTALELRVEDTRFRVIPVLLPGATVPGKSELPKFLRRLTW